MTTYKILWIVAARAGSKGIPNKNIKQLGALPLLAYRIKAARKIAGKEDVWISTDSNEYADIAESCGATVPFIRPEHLATDTASSSEVVLHAMEWAEKNRRKYDLIGLLEPTSPFVHSAELVKAASSLYNDDAADAVVAVRQVRPSTFYIQEKSRYLGQIAANIASMSRSIRRQEETVEVTPSGGFYIAKWDSFKKLKTFYTEKTLAYEVDDLAGLEIDEPIDFLWAQFLIDQKLINLSDII